MTPIVNVKDIVESNGKTVEQNNLEQGHKFPLGTLVKFRIGNYRSSNKDGTAYTNIEGHLFVVRHDRDCDGSPLYTLGECREMDKDLVENTFASMNRARAQIFLRGFYGLIHSIGEDSLSIAPTGDPVIFQ